MSDPITLFNIGKFLYDEYVDFNKFENQQIQVAKRRSTKTDSYTSNSTNTKTNSPQVNPSATNNPGEVSFGEDLYNAHEHLDSTHDDLISKMQSEVNNIGNSRTSNVQEPDFKGLEREALFWRWFDIKLNNQAYSLKATLAGIHDSIKLAKSA